MFSVTENGFIVLSSGSLDYEEVKEVQFDVVVSEVDQPNTRSSEVTVKVIVIDVNDNNPEFPISGYATQLKEGTGRRPVIKVGCRNILIHACIFTALKNL